MLLAIERASGGVSIMNLTEGAVQADEIAKWEEVTGFVASRVVEVDRASFPTNRFARNAWILDPSGRKVVIDMGAARILVMEMLKIAALRKYRAVQADINFSDSDAEAERLRVTSIVQNANFNASPNPERLESDLQAEMSKI